MLSRHFLVLFATLLAASPVSATHSQQGAKLVGTGAVTGQFGSYQGSAVAVSADGNTAVVGGAIDNDQTGAVWVFTRSAGVWSQQGTKLIGSGGSFVSEGYAVAVSADGNTTVVGSFGGGVWVFTRSAGVWSQQGLKLVGTGVTGFAIQGRSVAVSGDGNTLIFGAELDNSSAGAVWVFTRSAGVWTQQGNKLVGTGAVGAASQGISVAISGDGNTAVVGGSGDNSSKGAAWVFTRTGGVWGQQGNKLVGTGAVGAANQGSSVALSADGNTTILGGTGDNSNAGASWVFTRTADVWSQQGDKLVGTGAVGPAFQGGSVAVSADGNMAAVGGPYDNDPNPIGAMWVFARTAGVWSQHGDKMVGTGAVGSSNQGNSVSLSSDGTTVIVGGQSDNNHDGAAWVFFDATPVSVAPGSGIDRSPKTAMSLIVYANPTRAPLRFAVSAATNQSQPARVRIHDVSGRLVKSMEIGCPSLGTTNLTWDGIDDAGKPVSSGTYWLRLEAGGSPHASLMVTVLR